MKLCLSPKCAHGCHGHVAPPETKRLVAQNWVAGRSRGEWDFKYTLERSDGPEIKDDLWGQRRREVAS